jgi:hypothetical protein
MELSPSWEAASCAATQELRAVSGTWSFITVFTRALHRSLSWARSVQSIPAYPISLRSVLILSNSVALCALRRDELERQAKTRRMVCLKTHAHTEGKNLQLSAAHHKTRKVTRCMGPRGLALDTGKWQLDAPAGYPPDWKLCGTQSRPTTNHSKQSPMDQSP